MLGSRDGQPTPIPYRPRMRLTCSLSFLLALGAAPSSTHAQRVTDARTGPSRPAVDPKDANRLSPDSIALPRPHPTAARVLSGFGVGVGLGMAGLFSGICASHPCGWDFMYTGVAGYWLGGVIGTAAVKANRCSFSQRFGRSLVGSLPGTVVGFGVARASHMSRDMAAFAATTVVALAPIVSSTIALRTCD